MNTINTDTLNLIKSFESLKLDAYVDPSTGDEPITIGYGTTIYPDGKKVKLGDKISEAFADQCLLYDTQKFASVISKNVNRTISDNQFGALVSFAYNVGTGNFKSSTLLKKVNINPKDLSIASEFLKWTRANGKVMNGLVRRRSAESALYFK